MDRKQLRAFVAVAEHRSFSAGARALGTVQSNVSAHIARLEKELGVTLIDRATNDPTDEGRAVLERARRIEAEFEALDADVASLRDVVSGSVRIGAIGTTARWLVAPLLTSVTDRYPEIRVIVLDATTSSLVLNLVSGTIDLAIVNLPIDEPDLIVEPLFDEDRILIVPAGHPLHDRDSITLVELAGHDLLLEARGTAFRDVLDAAAAEQGIELRPKAELDGMRLLASLVFAGFGAGIVPASAIPPNLGGGWRRIPVEGVPGRSVGLARRRRGLLTAAQRVVADLIRHTIAEGAGDVPGVYPTVRLPS
ncbi:LysR family transcriptional regulator [Dermatobacter hominis]|uniref:LysR family transcriptional regulator n=1 Tax=Dermatobacter hominis TaxID=2884263 RepID=UPI001D12EF66|nr:LysR family transcriptional regulator [Dermatobacter hominis]UDY36769.1 LysR family transcriptional regulator [Dermatobacter hominis]